ncbi:MAG TPA: hypothetical protein VGF39_06610, partial [Stellaceae bacterium]
MPIQFTTVILTRDVDRFLAIALASVPTLWNKAGTCGRAALPCCGTRPQQRTGNNPDAQWKLKML